MVKIYFNYVKPPAYLLHLYINCHQNSVYIVWLQSWMYWFPTSDISLQILHNLVLFQIFHHFHINAVSLPLISNHSDREIHCHMVVKSTKVPQWLEFPGHTQSSTPAGLDDKPTAWWESPADNEGNMINAELMLSEWYLFRCLSDLVTFFNHGWPHSAFEWVWMGTLPWKPGWTNDILITWMPRAAMVVWCCGVDSTKGAVGSL